jgi:hypothetical protein
VIGELFDKLGSIDGANRNLRGSLFELLVGHVVQASLSGWLEIGKLVSGDGFQAEIDVRLIAASDVWIYECKGYQPDHMIGVHEIEAWLKNRVPGIYKATRSEQRFDGFNVHFEFWTSGGFTPEAIGVLEDAAARTKRYSIGWKSGRDVRSEITRLKSPGLAAMFDQHYLDHPIARFDRKYDGAVALVDLKLDLELGDRIEESTDYSSWMELAPLELPDFSSRPTVAGLLADQSRLPNDVA